MNSYVENLIRARDILGSFDKVGDVCGGLSGKAVLKWKVRGKPPRTEYTGETDYASKIEVATNGQVKKHDLIPRVN